MMDPIRQWIIEAIRDKTGMTAKEAENLRKESRYPKCLKCGECCELALCIPAEILFGRLDRCPLLTEQGCAMVGNLAGTPLEDTIREVLGVGCGCFLKGEGG